MTSTMIAGREVDVDAEGFMTDPSQWNPEVGKSLAEAIGVEWNEDVEAAVQFARSDHAEQGETPTLRRMAVAGGVPTKQMFALFPKKPAKKMAYVAGLPKPRGCV